LRWGQRLSWSISALSGTLEIDAETERLKSETAWLKQDNVKLDGIILWTKNETEQLKREKERLAVLASKIDSSCSKHGINLPLAQIPKQP
jgi:hypothetical protein